MSNKTKKFEQEAKAFFAAEKNANVSTVYVTSDGNLFRAEHYADNWKTQLQNREVEVYNRHVAKSEPSIDDDENTSDENKWAGSNDAVREELVRQYIELFDTKPAHNIGLDKLQDKITAKRLELAKETEANANQEGSADNENK